MKIYRTDAAAPLWLVDARMTFDRYVSNCPQCKGEIRIVYDRPGLTWRCTSCRVELDVDHEGKILSARNLQPWHLGPPDILCSQCGVRLVKCDNGFSCRPCGREVRA